VGLLTGLVTLPLAPVRGVTWVAQKLTEAAEQEYRDPVRVRAELQELVRQLEAGLITDEEFDAAEDALLARLG
jgi:hypothetical protein